jgi:site-specific recombinase XerD
VVKLLKSIKKRREGEHVFLTYRLTPWNRFSLGLRVRRAREKAGIPDDAKLYGVRHAFGTRGVVNGCDIKTLAELMGHTTTRMTEHYLHLAGQREHLASAMLLVNGRRRDA